MNQKTKKAHLEAFMRLIHTLLIDKIIKFFKRSAIKTLAIKRHRRLSLRGKLQSS